MASCFASLWDSRVYKQIGLSFLCLLLGPVPAVCFFPIPMCQDFVVTADVVLFYCYSLETCLFPKERQKGGSSRWEGRRGGTVKTLGWGKTQVLCEKKSIFHEGEEKSIVNKNIYDNDITPLKEVSRVIQFSLLTIQQPSSVCLI